MSPPWTFADVPDQHGRVVVITGANTGLGLATAKLFAARHASVVLACRDPRKAADAAATIRDITEHDQNGTRRGSPSSWLRFMQCDCAWMYSPPARHVTSEGHTTAPHPTLIQSPVVGSAESTPVRTGASGAAWRIHDHNPASS